MMGILSNIFKSNKRSSISAPSDWLIKSLSSLFGNQATSGQSVNADSALSIASVHACVRVISDGISGLGLKLYYEDENNRKQIYAHYSNAVINEPNSYQTRYDFTK